MKCAASIDLKAEEAGLLAYCRSEGLSAEFYTADELRAVRGEFTPSEFVKSITGVDNVCERAALRNAETLLVKKTARSGVTVAAAANIGRCALRKLAVVGIGPGNYENMDDPAPTARCASAT